MPTFESGSGLSGDYLDTWVRHREWIVNNSDNKVGESSESYVRKYLEHYVWKSPVLYSSAFFNAKKEFLKEMDGLVSEYNHLPFEERRDLKVCDKYIERAKSIIDGKSLVR